MSGKKIMAILALAAVVSFLFVAGLLFAVWLALQP